ncbi:DMT family transporter [Pseudothioclava arenosa]|uniref:EamA family transporter n=1 Tax=Pseudothioclava arenosa TaxID=1795308 RepID=A0A2A4CN57_9RHOB|nr:EamA family transporter [Pseudothioclava arenosa]PCD75682.1 EamA family transporter [Pseudothioclava arenosa]
MTSAQSGKTRATLIGFSAVALWALLALFTVGAQPVPALQLNAICFAIGGTIGLIWCAATGTLPLLRAVPLRAYAIGTAGLFGYHYLYFSALSLAPPAEAGLIAYLWPLLIVLFSGLLPGERLRAGHVIGALVAFGGAALIVAKSGFSASAEALPGYALAFLCALTWSSYSLISRRFGQVPTAAVTVYCLATSVLSLVAHLALEDTVWPATTLGWASVAALGLGPVGLAFFTWDIGVKRGDIQMLGTLSYAAPLLSTTVLILAGFAAASPRLLLAAVMIAAGAFLAAMASRKR